MDKVTYYIINLLKEHGPNAVFAIVTLIVGFWIINRMSHLLVRLMKRSNYDTTVLTFLQSLFSVVFKVMLCVSVAGMVGISTASFVAVIGAAGLAVGLALQGSLANLAGGLLILIFHPFREGDLIESDGHIGFVQQIQIFNTIITTLDNKRVVLPNGNVSNNSITNLSAEGSIRVEIVVGIAYNADIKHARNVIMEVMNAHPKVLQDPSPSVNVLELADSSINLAVRPYATAEDYWDVYFEVLELTKEALDRAGIQIPFPQREVTILGDGKLKVFD